MSAHDSGGLKRLHRVRVSSLGLARRNIMEEDMLGLRWRKKEAKVGAYLAGGKTDCCVLFHKARSMSDGDIPASRSMRVCRGRAKLCRAAGRKGEELREIVASILSAPSVWRRRYLTPLSLWQIQENKARSCGCRSERQPATSFHVPCQDD